METYSYKTVKEAVTSEYREKGSKFLGYTQAVTDLEEVMFFLEEIKEQHPKATHHCYAYRLGFEKDKNQIYSSVDILLHVNKNEPLGRIFFESLEMSKRLSTNRLINTS